MFEKLVFKDNEENEFQKYLNLKGRFLHKQVYDILLEDNPEEVSYSELNSIIRYDKRLRDKLYIYLATCEEYWRGKLIDSFDVSENAPTYKGHNFCKQLPEDLHTQNKENCSSNLYFKLDCDFSVLLDICCKMSLLSDDGKISCIKKLRNHTMHHNLLILGSAHNKTELSSVQSSLETQINALRDLLPEEMRAGYISDIKKLKNGLCMTKYYLQEDETNHGICFKK